MRSFLKRIAAAAAILVFGWMSLMQVEARAEQGVFDDRIVFGESAAFDGPSAALGLGMREHEAPDRGECRVRARRRGGYAHLECGAADRHGSGCTFHWPLHRRPLSAQPGARQRDQRSWLL